MDKKTKKIKFVLPARSRYDVFKYGEFMFRVDRNLKPIPVEVPSGVADLLLQMTDKSCRCHYRPPRKMFEEVFN